MAELSDEQSAAADRLMTTLRLECAKTGLTEKLGPDTVAQCAFIVVGEIVACFNNSVTLEEGFEGKSLLDVVKEEAPTYIDHGVRNYTEAMARTSESPTV